MNIGKALTLCRTQREMTKTLLSKEAGVSVAYITLLEQGKRDPNLSTINQLCHALKVPTSIFMFLASDVSEREGISTELAEKLAHTALLLIGGEAN
ncbi:helix-turn-helix transcriptional regulator [Shewanella algae]|uniref:helix-turn-helix domain-containing protein n=1 Tax=Shewanella algae TaxID=38313 RepID=UPI00300526AD